MSAALSITVEHAALCACLEKPYHCNYLTLAHICTDSEEPWRSGLYVLVLLTPNKGLLFYLTDWPLSC